MDGLRVCVRDQIDSSSHEPYNSQIGTYRLQVSSQGEASVDARWIIHGILADLQCIFLRSSRQGAVM